MPDPDQGQPDQDQPAGRPVPGKPKQPPAPRPPAPASRKGGFQGHGGKTDKNHRTKNPGTGRARGRPNKNRG